MKSGVTLQQMLTEVKRQSESKEDYLIAPNRLRMESYGKEMFLHLSDDSGTELIEPMTITGIAHRQIGTHLRIPAAYYDRMREERPDLLAYNANTWFKQESSQRMLRTLDGSARAYLSNRYRRMHDIPLNDTQRFFAEKNHNLVYKFLHEKNLPASEYYDIIIFGYLRAVQRYLTDPNLAGYSFATVAWRAMEGEIVNAHRTARRRFRVIRFVRPRQTYTGHLTRHSTPTVTDEEALRESEVALLLHALAKRVTPQQMEIIRLRTKGYQTNEIAQMQNTSLYHVNTLLDNARFIVVELCRDA